MAGFIVFLLACVSQASALELASCQGHSLWITVPVERAAVEKWLDENLQAADRYQVVLDKVDDTKHPIQIEWDSFHSCKAVGTILPYPPFNEVATMIPYVHWKNKTGVHFQPWSIVNNLFGASAMLLTGSKHVTESTGGAQYPAVPSTWSQWTEAEGSILSLRDAHVETLLNSTVLEASDGAWREIVSLKHTKSVTYDKCAASGFKEKYSCNTIQWDILEAAKLVNGELDTTQGKTNFFPASLKGSITQLRQQLPGLEAYAVRSTMTAKLGCGSDEQIIV